jgi:hypothetical protein
MPFVVNFDQAFAAEFRALPEAVQDEIRAYAVALAARGHQLGRPWADTLNGSKFARMKELRPTVNKVEWRVAFAFDANREAILLAAVQKGGQKDSVVYGRLISVADARFEAHEARLRPKGRKGK